MVHHGKFRVLSNQMFKFILMTFFFCLFIFAQNVKRFCFVFREGEKNLSLLRFTF